MRTCACVRTDETAGVLDLKPKNMIPGLIVVRNETLFKIEELKIKLS